MSNDLIISQIRQRLEILYQMVDELETGGGGGGGGGTTNYNDLTNKPSINGQILTGNKTLSELGAATSSDITQAFAPSTIALEEGGTFPSDSRNLLIEHKPLNVNDDQYYFLEETGVDYLYGSMPTSGAYPSLSYLRIMKSSFIVEFHNTEIDTVPTNGSDNFITSGGVETALAPITAGLVGLVDSGAKNACPWSGGTVATANSYAVTNSPIILSAGTYVLALKTTASDGRCELSVKNAANTRIGSATITMTSGYLSAEFTIAEDAAKFDLFSMRACTFSDVMICTKAAWDVSHKFAPYAPTNRELYEMILALQAGT